MKQLEELVGEWDVSAVLDGRTMATGTHRFTPVEGGAFLAYSGETKVADDAPQLWHDNAPTSFHVLIGLDDASGRYGYLYWDSREVRRVYEMSFEDRVWRVWGRAGEEFFQRFVGRVSDDGREIESRWERSTDGEAWELDFEGTYRRRPMP
jgi:hypothetical protein